jgi:guanylate kinase
VTGRFVQEVTGGDRSLPEVMSKVFVITGPSGVGKGTLISRLRERIPQLELSVSATTREPREGERDGHDYHFLEPEEFDRMAREGEFLEHATFSGNRYGTLRDEVEKRMRAGRPVVLEIEVQGARQVRAAMAGEGSEGDAVMIFIAPPDPAALRDRLAGRGTDSDEAIARRLETAKQELEAQVEFPHTVLNDDVERATDELEQIVRRELAT